MVFPGILDAEDMTVLVAALEDYCQTFRIPLDSEERLQAAKCALFLFTDGCRDPIELARRLKAKRR